MLQVGSSHDASFIRGDANDDGAVTIVDPLFLLFHLFAGGMSPYCADAADANDNGTMDVADAIVTLQGAFLGAGWIAQPFPDSGFDSTIDELACYENSTTR